MSNQQSMATLIAEFERWMKEHGFTNVDGDAVELQTDERTNEFQRGYLRDFCRRWDEMEAGDEASRTRFWPDGTKVIYQDAAEASEHRLRIMEAGPEAFEPYEQEEPEYSDDELDTDDDMGDDE